MKEMIWLCAGILIGWLFSGPVLIVMTERLGADVPESAGDAAAVGTGSE